MANETIKILNYYIKNFGGETISKLEKVEKESFNLINELEKMKEIKEDPKFHGEISSFRHSIQVANLLQRMYGIIYNQSSSKKIDSELLFNSFKYLPKKIETYLNQKIGNSSKKELLFLASLFHDIGKLHNFTNLMEEVRDQNLKGISRFIHHADFGKYYFDDELENIEKQILTFKNKKIKETNKLKVKFYSLTINYLKEIKNTFEQRKDFFQKLKLGKSEREYIEFIISKHMDLLNFYNQFQNVYLSRNEKNSQKQVQKFIKNILKIVEEYNELYIECIILSFLDLLESSLSAKKEVKTLYLFLNSCFFIKSNFKKIKTGALIEFDNDNLKIIEKKKEFNWSNLFKSEKYKKNAINIKKLIKNNNLKDIETLGYSKQDIGEIMKLIQNQ